MDEYRQGDYSSNREQGQGGPSGNRNGGTITAIIIILVIILGILIWSSFAKNNDQTDSDTDTSEEIESVESPLEEEIISPSTSPTL